MNVIAVDLGGTRIKTGIIKDGELQAFKIIEAVHGTGLAAYLPFIASDVINLCKETRAYDIAGFGLGFPGLVDTENNTIIATSKKYDDAPVLNLVEWAKDTFGLELKLENDARLACLGEWKYGAGKGSSDMVMCTLGTGVGSSAIINGRILRGKHFQAGVLGGHSIIDFQNSTDSCSCGKFGCVEATASTWRMKSLAENHPLFKESLLNQADKIDSALVFNLSIIGDELAIILKDHCLSAWAAGIVNLIHAYDPEVVVIGGGIMHSGNVLLPEFKRIIAERAWCPSGIPKIRQAIYPDTAVLLGAMTLFDTVIHEKIP